MTQLKTTQKTLWAYEYIYDQNHLQIFTISPNGNFILMIVFSSYKYS